MTRRRTLLYSGLSRNNKDDDDDVGIMDYARGWAWQQFLLHRRLALQRKRAAAAASGQHLSSAADDEDDGSDDEDADAILLLQHAPVYTLGRGADERHLTFLSDDHPNNVAVRERLSRSYRGPGSCRLSLDRSLAPDDWLLSNEPRCSVVDDLCDAVVDRRVQPAVLAPNGVPIYRVERGGEVTFHGPGQLVVYPVIDLRRPPYQKDLHWFLRCTEQVVIDTLSHYGIPSGRDDVNTGVWCGEDKIAAVGVSASRWITSHGFAINVHPDLSYFDTSIILPCGVERRGVTSMAELIRKQHEQKKFSDDNVTIPTVQQVARIVLKKLQDVFDIPKVEHGMAIV